MPSVNSARARINMAICPCSGSMRRTTIGLPRMAEQFDAAYRKGGGARPVCDGPAGWRGWTPFVYACCGVVRYGDSFLKAQNLLPLGDSVLPAPEPPDMPMPASLGDEDKDIWRRFLLAPPYKTLVANETRPIVDIRGGFRSIACRQ